jgi:choline dehydrogenase-like flavoprotein
MIPNDDSYCEIDPQTKDQYGIPTLRFHWKWSEHEKRQALHSHKIFTEVIEQMGGRVTDKQDLLPGGFIIHEVGGAIMGTNPQNSVVNQWGQSWDVKNLFITDGAPFPSNADKNPTLTIMALAWRASDYMLAAMKRKEL